MYNQISAFSRSFQITQYIPRVTTSNLPGSSKQIMKYSSISCLPEYMLISALPDIPSDTFHKYHEALIHPQQITFGNKSKVVYLGPYIYKQGRQCRLAQMQTNVCTQRPLCWRRCLLLPFYTFVCHQASYRMSLIVFIHECSIFVAVWAGRFVYNYLVLLF